MGRIAHWEKKFYKPGQLIMATAEQYSRFLRRKLSEDDLRRLDYPRPDPNRNEGVVKLYGDHFGFKKGKCKRCEKPFDVTFANRTQCDFHTESGRKQHPHGCCGKGLGLRGCRIAPSHVYKGNLYLDLQGYRRTQPSEHPVDGNYGVYALDTESVHTVRGLEVCKVSVIDPTLQVVYNEFCQPTSEIVDYNTIWSGVNEEDLQDVTTTYEEMRDEMLELFSADTIMIGHGLNHDLISMKIIHEKIVDTVMLYPHDSGLPLRKSLKEIARSVLQLSIQVGEGHDSKEDAEATMKLSLKNLEQNDEET
ncbi:putative exonuclease GOR [Ruditapes philippinarum]|uniref:putative exonuclease GOR n=1 Tax=Ruditapes philippinarum TaxID=129788 RepID=UPI00295ABFD7|nr:putative exonuclease GOR [Ruditapes philippinarum]